MGRVHSNLGFCHFWVICAFVDCITLNDTHRYYRSCFLADVRSIDIPKHVLSVRAICVKGSKDGMLEWFGVYREQACVLL